MPRVERGDSPYAPLPGRLRLTRDAAAAAMVLWRPRQDSNLRTWLRRPLLYPLSYEGGARRTGIDNHTGAAD